MISMSIEKLKLRLGQKLCDSSSEQYTHSKFVKPQRLIKTLNVLEQRFDDLENTIPLDEKIFRTISKLEYSGFESFTRRDWKNLAWALSKTLPDNKQKLIFSEIGKRIIHHFKQADVGLIGLVYFPLLYSYFALEDDDVKDKPAIWVQLREILKTHRSSVYKDLKRPKKWMNTLLDYSELLSELPTEVFVHGFIYDKDVSGIQNDLDSLKIAANSWFWDDLIKNSIQAVKMMNEDEYFKVTPRFLKLAEQNVLYTNDILIALLERYARTSKREQVYEVLKHLALNQWGNPQYDSSAGWNNVNADTKRMVIQWFVRADLEAFFKLFSSSADINRFNYWIRYIDKISFSQIFLGPAAFQSKQPQHREFRELNRGRLKKLVGSTQTNNAFMLRIENLYVIDFSDTGNACFIVNKIPYSENKLEVHRDTLKPWNNLLKLSHTPGWQSRFDGRMEELGVFLNHEKVKKINNRYSKN